MWGSDMVIQRTACRGRQCKLESLIKRITDVTESTEGFDHRSFGKLKDEVTYRSKSSEGFVGPRSGDNNAQLMIRFANHGFPHLTISTSKTVKNRRPPRRGSSMRSREAGQLPPISSLRYAPWPLRILRSGEAAK